MIYAMSDIHGCYDALTEAMSKVDLSGDSSYHEIWHDGESHYFIDGTVTRSHRLPVLAYDEERGKYLFL